MRRMSYAVVWDDGSGIYAGKLTLEDGDLVLQGLSQSNGSRRRLSSGLLTSVRIARERHNRLDGRPVLIFESSGGFLRVACLDGSGALHELAERLSAARS